MHIQYSSIYADLTTIRRIVAELNESESDSEDGFDGIDGSEVINPYILRFQLDIQVLLLILVFLVPQVHFFTLFVIKLVHFIFQ